MKNFPQIMGLLFGSAGANTYPKSRQVVALVSGSKLPFSELRP